MTDAPGRDPQARQMWLMFAVVVVTFLGSLGFTYWRDHDRAASEAKHNAMLRAQQSADLRCIADYENANRRRSEDLLSLSKPRNAAQSAEQKAFALLLNAVVNPAHLQPQPIVQRLATDLQRKQNAFVRADDAYNAALARNPLPPPLFSCSDRLGATSTPTPSPVGTPVVTSTTTATSLVPVPTTATATRVQPVPMPGQTGTVTVTKTRVVTRTPPPPPSCLVHPIPPCLLRS